MRQRFASQPNRLVVGIAGLQSVLVCWAQPALALEHGGSAYLLAFACCWALLGLPVVWLESGLGSTYQVALPIAVRRAGRAWAWVGWWSHGLGVLVLAVTLATMAWLLVHLLSATAESLTGGGRLVRIWAGRDPVIAAPISAMLLLLLSAVLWLLWSLRAGLQHVGAAVRGSLLVGAGLLLLAVPMLLAHPGSRAGIAQVLDWRWVALLQEDTWVFAALAALGTTGLGIGHGAYAASLQRRDADIGSQALLWWAVGGGMHLLLTVVLAGIRGSAAVAGLGDVGVEAGLGGFWVGTGTAGWGTVIGLLGLLVWLAGLAAVGLFALRGTWRDETGLFARSLTHRLLAVVVALALLLLAVGPWALGACADGLWLWAIPATVVLLVGGIGWLDAGRGLLDHLIAYSHWRPGRWLQPVWQVFVPLVGGAAVITGVARDEGAILWPGWLVLVLAGIWSLRPLAPLLQRWRSGLAIGALAVWVATIGWVIADRLPVQLLRQDIEQAHYRLAAGQPAAAAGDARGVIGLAQRAWAAGLYREAADLVGAVLVHHPGTGEVEELQRWSARLAEQAQRQIDRLDGDRVLVFRCLRLLRAAQAEARRSRLLSGIVKADWFPDSLLVAWPAEIDRLARLDPQTPGLEPARAVAARWHTLAGFIDPDADPRMLLDGPAKVATPATVARSELLALFERCRSREQLEVVADLLVGLGYRDLIPDRPASLAGSSTAELPWTGSLVLLLLVAGWTGLAWRILARRAADRPIIDPSAETLENVDPLEVDTEAVTVDGFLTDGSRSEFTTPVDAEDEPRSE